MNRMKLGWALLGGLTLGMAASAGSSLEGSWGGDRLRVVIDPSGATLQADCADGRISGPISLSSAGSFVATGSYDQHKGGPQAADAPGKVSARFSGELRGDVLTLTIQPSGASEAQVFRLRRGAAVKLVRCM